MTRPPPKPRPVPVRRYRYSKLRRRVAVRALDLAGGLTMRLWRLVRPVVRAGPPRRILVVQLDHLGDAVLSSPLCPRLKASYPGAAIDVLASPSNQAMPSTDAESSSPPRSTPAVIALLMRSAMQPSAMVERSTARKSEHVEAACSDRASASNC